MSLTLKLGQIMKEDDGSYTVHVFAERDSDKKIVGNKPFNVNSAAALKIRTKPFFEKLVNIEKNRENMRARAQSAIDEIMTEVIQ